MLDRSLCPPQGSFFSITWNGPTHPIATLSHQTGCRAVRVLKRSSMHELVSLTC
jgi:hypothetical protein